MTTQANDDERVILVNARDEEIGTEEKLRAHQLNLMHRAFSVFLVNDAGEFLLQRRAHQKYHSAGLWSNTACGHPRPGESVDVAARRRLREEMGVDCVLTEVAEFTYCVPVTTELTENEFDHVFIGVWNGTPHPDPAEVAEW
ncbi:MAG: isopentenyl-diphosphate Delta-isomerase, partial [Gemmatimonadaceae bacterium]